MRSQFTLFLDPLIGLYILTFALRLGMQWVRADFRNPIVQFVLKLTDPLVTPFRKILPPIAKVDSATLAVYILLCWAAMAILTTLECAATPGILTTLGLGIIYGVRMLLNTYTFVIFGYVILSWIGQGGHNPSIMMMSKLLTDLAQPVMRPIQKIIPPIGGLDLSPILVLIVLQALGNMLFSPASQLGRPYGCLLAGII